MEQEENDQISHSETPGIYHSQSKKDSCKQFQVRRRSPLESCSISGKRRVQESFAISEETRRRKSYSIQHSNAGGLSSRIYKAKNYYIHSKHQNDEKLKQSMELLFNQIKGQLEVHNARIVEESKDEVTQLLSEVKL